MSQKSTYKQIKKDNPYLAKLLRWQCKAVKAPYSVINNHPLWYQDYSWTEEQQDAYVNKASKYLWRNRRARNMITGLPYFSISEKLRSWCNRYLQLNKTSRAHQKRLDAWIYLRIRKSVKWYVLMYGWKLK